MRGEALAIRLGSVSGRKKGRGLVSFSGDGIALVSPESGEPQSVRGSQPGDVSLRWTREGNALFLGNRNKTACQVSRLGIQTGSRTAWKTFSPLDVAGVVVRALPPMSSITFSATSDNSPICSWWNT